MYICQHLIKYLLLGLVFLPHQLLAQNTVNGTWHSAFIVMGQSLLLDLEVDLSRKEVFIVNPELEGKPKVACSAITYEENKLNFSYTKGGLTFKGNYFEIGDSLVGFMSQAGLEWKVIFGRQVVEKLVVLRPQTPNAPFPYKTEELSFTNKTDGTEVFGTLTYPINTATDFPVVIFASGSGPQDRNCTILDHQSFWVLADILARQGIATFRFDDRGTGSSKASYASADLNDFASDVVASIDFLSVKEELKDHAIGLLGHSEGGMHILLAQKQRKKQVKFMVFLACIGLTGKETLVQQQYDIPLKNGMDEGYASWNKSVFEGVSELVLAETDPKKCAANLNEFLHEKILDAPAGAIDTTDSGISSFITGASNFINNEWGRQFLAFNAKDYLKSLNLPVLALFGSEDSQVNPITNSSAFKSAFTEKQLAQSTISILPGLNHLLQKCNSCSVLEYGELTETINPLVFSNIISFINQL